MKEAGSQAHEGVNSPSYLINLNERRADALRMLDFNRGDKPYTPPAVEHYPHSYYWDTALTAIARVRFGDTDGAVQELEQIKNNIHFSDNIHFDGFMPNMVFDQKGRRIDPERRTFTSRDHSDYTQPPIYAEAVMETYLNLRVSNPERAQDFLSDHYQTIVAHYDYFHRTRKNSDSGLYKIIHPHETGMDSLPQFDKYVFRITDRNMGPLNRAKGAANFISKMRLNQKLKKVEYNPQETDEIFKFYDVSFNSILANNFRITAQLSELVNNQEDSNRFTQYADSLEENILYTMWSNHTNSFHSIDEQGNQIPDQSISTLFPLVNSRLSIEQLSSLLTQLEDPNKFGANYLIPSVSRDSSKYDPNYSTSEIWRGPVWINTNWYIVERGLLMQAERLQHDNPDLASRCMDLSRRIVGSSVNLVNRRYSEFFNPETGHPLRVDGVSNFAWSTLAYAHTDSLYSR